VDERRASGHPLVIRPAPVVIWAIQSRLRKPSHQPPENGFVADVHTQRDLGLLAVAAEGALPDQQPGHDAALE
jgi:hypothetical protein